MKTWYAVTTTYDDKGNITANITDKTASENRPESSYSNLSRKDIYTDWFSSKPEADLFINEARNS